MIARLQAPRGPRTALGAGASFGPMSRSASQRWVLVGGFAVVAVVSRVAMAAVPFAYAEVGIAAPLTVMWRVIGPPRGAARSLTVAMAARATTTVRGRLAAETASRWNRPGGPSSKFERELEADAERRAAVGKR